MKNVLSIILLLLIIFSSNSLVSQNNSNNVVYRVQIAASKVKLSETKLDKIYPVENRFPEHKIMSVDIDEPWYKYLVGKYTTYEEADKARQQMNVKGAFIVAYKDYQRVRHISSVCQPDSHPSIRK